ncbi:MAG: tetratricopeptide repeat protein [Treponema sp.]|nr:tetratricopeptide repeat protein [Treponema sp.]
MKKRILFSVLISVSILFSSCNYKNTTILAKRIQHMEKASGNPGSIEEIKESIKKYDAEASEVVNKNAQIGIWYKILGTRYLDKKMYGEALECFQTALEFYPDNENLYYYVGLCAAYMSHAALDFDARGNTEKKENYLKLSENAYLRAINIYDRYANALRALGVLYLFELKEPEKAVIYFEKYLTVETRSIDGMMFLAQAYYLTEQFDKAVELYDKVIATTKSADKKALAEQNKKVVLDASYGN